LFSSRIGSARFGTARCSNSFVFDKNCPNFD
jgi:hypothetical protein